MSRPLTTPPVLVQLESPYRSKTKEGLALNRAYAIAALWDSVHFHDEAPFASHLLYTLVTDEDDAEERALGIDLGFAYGDLTNKTVVYTDLGVTPGMVEGIARAKNRGVPVETRTLHPSLVAALKVANGQ